MTHRFNQKGFAVLETAIIVVVAAIIGGAGYYVYHANHTKKNTASKNASSKTSAKDNGGKGGKAGPDTGPAKTEVFLINEWGVSSAIPTPPEQAALIQYKIVNSTPASAQFTTQELIDAGGSDCSADHEPAGLIMRAQPGDTFYLSDGSSSGKTVSQELASGDFQPYKQVGNYYYWYVHSQSGCGDVTKTGQLQTVASDEVKQIVTHLQGN